MPYKSIEDKRRNDRLYRLKNKKERDRKANLCKLRNPKKYALLKKEWKTNHPEKVKESSAKYRLKNKGMLNAKNREYQHSHLEIIRAKNSRRRTAITNAGGSFTKEEWRILKKFYNYRCLRCHKRKPLTSDHVIPVSRGGTSNIDNIQPLCSPCNSWKCDKIVDFRPNRSKHHDTTCNK